MVKTKKYIAHAGIHLHGRAAAQNSLGSIRLAAKLGFDFVEIDVRFTSDGEAVACHDASLNATFVNKDGSNITSEINVADYTLDELRYAYLLRADEPNMREPIPTLSDCAAAARDNNIILMVHPKISSETAIYSIRRICGDILGKHGYYIVSEDKAVRRVLELDPDMPTMAICREITDIEYFSKYPTCIIAVSWKAKNYDELVSEAHNRGKLVETTLNHDIRIDHKADIINYDYLAPCISNSTPTVDISLTSDSCGAGSINYDGEYIDFGVAEAVFELCGRAKLTVCGRSFELAAGSPTKYCAPVILSREIFRVTSEGDIKTINMRIAKIER